MSKAQKISFWILTVITLAGISAGLALLIPMTPSMLRSASNQLVAAGGRVAGDRAVTDYALAGSLDPANQAAYLGLATSDYNLDQPANALTALAKAGQGSAVSKIRVKSYLQLGRFTDAASSAGPLTLPDSSNQDLQLAGLAYTAAGRNNQALLLVPRISSPDAATSVSRAASSKVALAQELYATGLQDGSEALLKSLPSTYERNLLLARLMFEDGGRSNYISAASLLESDASLSPADLTIHQLLLEVYRSEKQAGAASVQASLIAKISRGHP